MKARGLLFLCLVAAGGCGYDTKEATITVISPNGTEVWYHGGADAEIAWSSTNVRSTVDIHYTVDGTAWEPVALDIPNTGVYIWTVPNEDSSLCRVRIRQFGGLGALDTSDEDFRIGQLPGSMIAHWKLDETTGTTVADSSGNGKVGSLVGFSFDTSSVPGKIGRALGFDGSGSYAEFFNTNELASPVTFCFWMKADTVQFSSQISGYQEASPNRWDIEIRPDNQLYWSEHGSSLYTSSTVTVQGGVWYHVAAVHNYPSTTVNVCVDGQEKATGSLMYDLKTGVTLKLFRGSSGNPFVGALDDVRLYGRVLTPAEIQALFDAGNQ